MSYQNTNFRLCIPPEERAAVTIGYDFIILQIIVIFKLNQTKYLLNFNSGEELGALIGLQTVMKVNTAAVLKRK